MKRITLGVLFLVSYIGAESPSYPCQSQYCTCGKTPEGITWECNPEPTGTLHNVQGNTELDNGGSIQNSVKLILNKSSRYLEVDCSGFTLTNTTVSSDIFDYFPNISFGTLKAVKINYCPLPKTSFQSFLTKLNITKLNFLNFYNSPSNIGTLSPPYFDNMVSSVSYITINDNPKITGLHSDLFKNMPQLESLYLRNNAIRKIDPETFQYLPKLRTLDLGSNNIEELHPDVFKHLKTLKTLNIDSNKLVNLTREHFSNLTNLDSLTISNNNITNLPSDVFSDLIKLKTIHANKNKFQTFPSDLFAKTKMLTTIQIRYHKNYLVTLPPALFSNLPKLTTVKLEESGISEFPPDLFRNSSNISKLDLSGHKKITTLPKELFEDCSKLSELNLSNNKLKNIPEEIFRSLLTVKKLDLSKNQIEEITKGMFTGLDSLEDLNFSRNKLKTIDDEAFHEFHCNLETVDFSYNQLTLQSSKSEGSSLSSCEHLKEIYLSNNIIDTIFNDWYITMTQLEVLDLKRNNFTTVPSELFYSTISKKLTVDLSDNQITHVNLKYLEKIISEANSFREENKIILNSNPLSCDCSNYYLIAFLSKNMDKKVYDKLDIETNVTCEEVSINKLPLSSVFCTVEDQCPQHCSCTHWPFYLRIKVNCSSVHLTEMPQVLPEIDQTDIQLILHNNSIQRLLENPPQVYNKVTELDLSNNNLINLNSMWTYLPNLRKLDLSYNSLSSINRDFLKNISSTLDPSSLALFGNPWQCDCNIEALHQFALNKHYYLINSENIICYQKDKPLNQMTVKDFCETVFDRFIPWLVVLGTTGFLFGILVALYYRYEHEVKVWLFAHKLFLWLFKDEADKDKEFDAFVSFSNEDVQYVTKELIPGLEKNFKICYHMRDFLPGKWIHQQIEEYIGKSRRTIVVLSDNFLKSTWAMHEFRTAHAHSVEDNCSRVVVLIYGDMPNQDNMEPEMRAYMKTHTYIESNDNWFWHKLRYALPHSTSKPTDKIGMTPVSNFVINFEPKFMKPMQPSEILQKG